MKRGFIILLLVVIVWVAVSNINKINRTLQPEAQIQNNEKETGEEVKVEELPRIHFKAPSFELKGLDDKSYTLESVKGKPIVLNFWASWCDPCKKEAPEMVKLYRNYKDYLEIYAVNLTTGDNLESVKKFVDEYGFSFPVLLDSKDVAASKYNIQAIPTTFFINADGIIVDQIIGYGGKTLLAKKFESLVSNK